MKIRLCDRCGKETTQPQIMASYIDFCHDCQEEFFDWMESGHGPFEKREQERQGSLKKDLTRGSA
jgi:hypothetical protein